MHRGIETIVLLWDGSGVKGLPSGSTVKYPPAMQEPQETGFNPCVGKIPWRRKWLPSPVFFSGKSHGLRSLVAIGSQTVVHSVTKSQTGLSY